MRTKLFWLIPALIVSAFAGSRPVQGDFTLPSTVLFTHSNYDYAPSVIQEGNVQKFWWCGLGTVPGTNFNTDVIYYRTWNGDWSAITMVLWPSATGRDSYYTCDPSVIQGSFYNHDNGLTYTYAMYYTATDVVEGINNRIGLAYSNDGQNWVKYRNNPVIYPQVYPTSGYGAGQAATYNRNGRSYLAVFHTDTSTSYGTRMWVRTTRDGRHFSAPTLLSNQGLPLAANSDFAYDSTTGYFYAAIGLPGRPGDRETYGFAFARMPASQLIRGQGVWEALGYVNQNLTGYYLNHSPGLLRDKYGNLTPWLPVVEAYFAQGNNDPNTWDLTWAMWRPDPNTLAFNRTYNSTTGDHWITTGYIAPGYYQESTLGYLYMAPQAGTQPLYGCQVGGDHFISVAADCEGQQILGENGWIYPSPPIGIPNQALYRCLVRSGTDHFVSPDPGCEGQITEYGGNPIGYAKTTP